MSLRPFYLPREFTYVIFTYVPPSGNVREAVSMIGNHIYIYMTQKQLFLMHKKIVTADFKVSSSSTNYLLKPLVLTGHHLKFLSFVQNNWLILCLLFLTRVLVLTQSLYVGKFELMLAVIKVCDKLTVLVDFFDLL